MKQAFRFLFIASLFVILITQHSYAQDRITKLQTMLEELSMDVPGLEENVDISVNQTNLSDFIRGVAKTNSLNITVDPAIDIKITSNFSKVKVKDILIYLCQNYELDILIQGSIIQLKKYVPAPKIASPAQLYQPNITYQQSSDLINLDLKNDTLSSVVKILTKLTGKNILCLQELNNQIVSGFIQQANLEQALEKLGLINNFSVTKTLDGFYVLDKKSNTALKLSEDPKSKKTGENSNSPDSIQFNLEIDSTGLISLQGTNIPLKPTLDQLAKLCKINYFFYSEIKGTTTINVKKSAFNELIFYLFKGTNYAYRYENGIYFFGDQQAEGVRQCRLFKFQNRSVDKISEFIPADIKKGVDMKEFPEQNSLVLSGALSNIVNLEQFLRDIDKSVPLIIIEVLIVDSKTGRTTTTGIEAGIGTSKATSSGTVFPEFNYNMNAQTINSMINSFNGFGVVKLGKVTENFYLNLNLMEEQGIVKVRSTPKLATLNGHEATMSLGNTEYYLEESNNVIGSQNPQNIITKQYKSVKADFSLTIKPIISGNESITLEIKVDQSDFTGRISPQAPPGAVSRNFSSVIRVGNEEMILLGGLEKKSMSDSGSGVPLLSRIPVLKWIFSSRKKEKSNSKLNIFIKPIVVY